MITRIAFQKIPAKTIKALICPYFGEHGKLQNVYAQYQKCYLNKVEP